MPIDPRANSAEKLVPPAPLPLVSRAALRRVRDAMPPPTACPYCEGPVALVCNSEIYGREFGAWPYAYRCVPCDAMVGLHPATDLPLGTLANKQLRAARATNKQLFHRVKDRFGFTRSQAYEWLALQMGIPKAECHFGWFDLARCAQAGAVCKEVRRG
ncbi:DUF3268 family zinc-finger domain-containing protein [Pseudomonas sp. PDM13]|uniref:DUF3268 family zinc-finger domain-containing protein n=1 Tax=Pseudomonas sp. PDM13 TaxID=2769255 RepID=UPI0021E00808|nr:DUF3268 family zinc-finger domain-containing protein [Pseudomonas sp. PDM13]MCU9949828.1 DUF3268 family zinc-finger domain-containing protein [Pseudomonas sp. PDM13]